MRLRNNPHAKIKLKNSNLVIKSFPFLLPAKTTLEIGMGKGDMITKMAKCKSNHFFIGMEKYATVALYALKKAEDLELTNFFIINEDASNISNIFKGYVDTLWLTFSDPWPKKRHHKRRLTNFLFLEKYKKILSKNSIIKLKTDNNNFFEYSKKTLIASGFKIINSTNNLHNSIFILNNVMTEYEKKWKDKGYKINYLEAKK